VKSASEVILQTLDVVLSEVSASLNLYEDKVLSRRVLDPVQLSAGDIDRISSRHRSSFSVEGQYAFALDDKPMLGAEPVSLVGKSLAG
jgi:hypothetical protein